MYLLPLSCCIYVTCDSGPVPHEYHWPELIMKHCVTGNTLSKWIFKFSGRIILYLQEIPAKPPLQTRDSLQRLCSTMKHRILSRAFYGCKYPKYTIESAVDVS